MTFNASCAPGPDAAAGAQQLSQDVSALVLYLDPESIAIQTPPFPDGDRVFARFLRELSREAGKLADIIDVDGAGRHHMPPIEYDDPDAR
jgi:hypothetical protein